MSTLKSLEIPGYQVMQYLGSGARSTIWQIRDNQTGDVFALKRVVCHDSDDYRYMEQATNEYEVGSQLDHPFIRRIYQIRRVKKWMRVKELHLVMELCEGQTVQDNRPASLEEAVRIFQEVAKALMYMNARGFVHADMKPNNILISPAGAIKIIDLGQSCLMGTIKKRIQGTPDFIAPEQVLRQPLDSRTDVFNFGAALYWTLTGRAIPTILPKKAGVTLVADTALIPPEKMNPDIPPSLSKLVCDCVEAVPSRRPTTMNEVSSRLSLITITLNRKAAEGSNSQGK